ncbi:DNA-binding SARP family transcriptional activator [Nocardiopsis sp. Huas11]|uniref:AfsR/SARP family transcriptional regulator n=1 Tax=Nocardiopsis sp. Huas11 TaxID=2183912 RepID=UPI000EAB8872|nr:AfsR/SARP family transcriptional regulator [Nocardiopsis sp. Huas11]RKS09670.1 DNA-binding SARP family transcriptional activator [Nocardiopsis sp. Huas11]
MINFSVLGSLELRSEDGVHVPPGTKVRKLLALLLLRANQVVDTGTVTEELWDGRPAPGGAAILRTHVYHLRRSLPAGTATVTTEPTGYLLSVDPEQLDATVFARRVEEGRALVRQDRMEEAAQHLREALDLWRGRVLANTSAGPVLSRHITYLEELRHHAVELRVEADMRLGRHRELVPELRSLIAADPLSEWYHDQLITALHRSGRRGEALTAYHDLRRLLDEELGLQPSERAQRLQHEILMADGPRGAHPFARPRPVRAAS